MRGINTYHLYNLGNKITRIVSQASGHSTPRAAADMFVPLMEAQAALDMLLKGDPVTLDIARSDAQALLSKLGTVFNKHFIDGPSRQFRFPGGEEGIDTHELALIRTLAEKFESSLATDLSRRAIYSVPRRGLFDVRNLAEHADLQFSEANQNALSDGVREELRAAGSALAFGLAPAACFHLIRAIEGVFSRYLEIHVGKTAKSDDAPPSLWRDGLNRLNNLNKEKTGEKGSKDRNPSPDPRILSLLQDVNSRYRQPLNDGTTRFSVDDAIVFFGLSGSLITLMLANTSLEKTAERAAERTFVQQQDNEQRLAAE